MNKYIDADKLKAEIERYKQGAAIARFDNAGENTDYFQGKVDLCDDLTHIIDSLQQEQPEADFEEEWEKFENWVESYNQSDYPTCYEPKQIARHFYEFGKSSKEE